MGARRDATRPRRGGKFHGGLLERPAGAAGLRHRLAGKPERGHDCGKPVGGNAGGAGRGAGQRLFPGRRAHGDDAGRRHRGPGVPRGQHHYAQRRAGGCALASHSGGGAVMAATWLEGPTVEPVSVNEARVYLRIEGTEEDAGLAAFLKVARELCEAFTGLVLIATRFLETKPFDVVENAGVPWSAGRCVRLAKGPLQ